MAVIVVCRAHRAAKSVLDLSFDVMRQAREQNLEKRQVCSERRHVEARVCFVGTKTIGLVPDHVVGLVELLAACLSETGFLALQWEHGQKNGAGDEHHDCQCRSEHERHHAVGAIVCIAADRS